MNNNVERIGAMVIMPLIDIVRIPRERLTEIINEQLARELSHFIINNMELLPISYRKNIDANTGNQEHTIKINLISNEELKRLRKIESEYMTYNNLKQSEVER